MRLIVVILCLLLTSCAMSDYPGVPVQAAQVRASLENRHDLVIPTYDEVYQTTSLDELWKANVDSWRHERGEAWDCEDNAEAMLVQLRRHADQRGDAKAPAAFLMPAIMRDGRRHAVVVALCHTATGATWNYWDASNMRQISRLDILKPLTSP